MNSYQKPLGWSGGTVGDACILQTGGTPSRSRPEYWNGDIPWIKTGEVDYRLIKEAEEHITPAGLKNSNAKILPPGTLLMAMYGQGVTRGKVAITGIAAATNQACAAIVPKEQSHLTTDFLFWFLTYQYEELRNRGHGANQRNLSMALIKAFEIAYPPLPEQKKIAHILSTVQRAIEAQERIIQTTTELKKALMHKLFTEGLRGEPQKQTEIGPVPESWEVVALGEFFQIKHGYAFDGEFFKQAGDYILMTPGHFHEEGGFRDQGEKTKFFTGDVPQEYVLAKDDLVVAMTEQKSGLLGSAAFVPDGNCYLHNQRLGLIVDLNTKRMSKRYLFHVFNHPHLRLEVAKTSTGSKVKHTSPTKIRAVKVGIPPTVGEQEEIASVLSATQQKINFAANKKDQLQDLFRTLLHELMTAKTRVYEMELSE